MQSILFNGNNVTVSKLHSQKQLELDRCLVLPAQSGVLTLTGFVADKRGELLCFFVLFRVYWQLANQLKSSLPQTKREGVSTLPVSLIIFQSGEDKSHVSSGSTKVLCQPTFFL